MDSTNRFVSQLDEFFQGNIGLKELEAALDAIAPGSQESQQVLGLLNEAFASGRLPTQIYQLLNSKLDASNSSIDDRTIQVAFEEEGAADVSVHSAPPPHTQEDNPEAVPFTEPPDESTRIVAPDATRIVKPEAIDSPLAAEAAPSDSISDITQHSEATRSNWARPDQWSETQSGPIQIGSVIKGRFVIEKQLGKGGMGTVFKARDRIKEEAQDTDPYVAIKVLNKEFRNHPQALITLQREATKSQSLRHPNIIAVNDFDRDGTVVYMQMELIRGQSLSDYIRRFRQGGASREDAYPIIMEMAAGLAYAHGREIVHSDFKPGNVFLTEDNRVKILDFGIARAVQYGRVGRASQEDFDAGELGALTPGYASLEMLNGEPPDPSDDVYALAVTAYQLLSGDHPFARKTAKEALVANSKPRPIKGLKRREWRTIAKGLELRREDRIPDAAQFMRSFRGPTRNVRWAVATILILFGVATYFAYTSFQEPAPPFPWTNLTTVEQADFNEKVASGQAWLENDPPWIGGAFNDFDGAYDVHPRNPLATKGLKAVATAFIESADNAATRKDKERILIDLVAISDNEYLSEHKGLQQLREQLAEDLRQ